MFTKPHSKVINAKKLLGNRGFVCTGLYASIINFTEEFEEMLAFLAILIHHLPAASGVTVRIDASVYSWL